MFLAHERIAKSPGLHCFNNLLISFAIDKWKSMEDALYKKNKFASTEKLIITTKTLIEAGLIKE